MIASTATESTICPQASPAAKGTEPMAAWTVALGRYAMTQKMRSFHVRFVFMVQKRTPADRKSTRLNSSHANESRMPSSA